MNTVSLAENGGNSGNRERNMGVELLRIVAMLMVVILHILGQGGVLAATEPGTAGYAAAYLLETLSYCAVNCYALISGYVGGTGHFRFSRVLETHARVLFYTILITVGFVAFVPEVTGLSLLKNAVFPVMTGQYWYYTAYFGVMLFEPALQLLTARMTRTGLRNLVLAAVLFFSVLPTVFVSDVFHTAGGYSVLWLTVLYLTGAYLGKYGCPFLKKAWAAALIYAACTAVTWGAHMLAASGTDVPVPNLLSYTSPTILLAGAALLSVFSKLRLPEAPQRAVRVFAPLSFGVYLIHAHPLVWEYLMRERFSALAGAPAAGLFFAVIGIAAVIYAGCSLIELVRSKLFSLAGMRALCAKLGARAEKLFGM